MKLPKYVKKNNRIYEFVKAYSDFYLYQDIITHTTTTFKKIDLHLIEETKKVTENKSRYFPRW